MDGAHQVGVEGFVDEPWQVVQRDEHRLELTAPGAPDHKLSCNDDHYSCELTLGTLGIVLYTAGPYVDDRGNGVGSERLEEGPKWRLQSFPYVFRVGGEAIR